MKWENKGLRSTFFVSSLGSCLAEEFRSVFGRSCSVSFGSNFPCCELERGGKLGRKVCLWDPLGAVRGV